MDEQLSDIFATCLQRIEAGATLEECLAAYPAERAQLEPLLRVATRLQALPRPGPLPATAQGAITGRVLGQLQAQHTAVTGAMRSPQPSAGPQRIDPSALLAGVLRALGYRGPLAQPWLRLGALALALLLAVVLATTAYAAVRAIFPSPPAAPSALAPATRFDLQGTIEAMSESTLVIAGVMVDLGPQTAITGTPAVGASARASGQIRDDGTLLAETITVESADAIATPAIEVTLTPTEAPIAVATTAPSPSPEPAPPTAAPTTPPAPTDAPTAPPAPTAASVAPQPAGDPLVQLRQLLEAGQADGRAGKEGPELLKKLSEAERALAEGNGQRAGDQLRDLYQKLREKAREGKIDPGFAQEAQTLIAAVGEAYQIRTVPDEERGGPPDEGRGRGEGEDPGEGEGRGRGEGRGDD